MKQVQLIVLLIVFGTSIALSQNHKAIPKSKISNGIRLNLSKEIKLVKAYLFYNGGERVSDSNMADLNQNINMLIQINRGGWVEKDGKVSIGASEKIITSTGYNIK